MQLPCDPHNQSFFPRLTPLWAAACAALCLPFAAGEAVSAAFVALACLLAALPAPPLCPPARPDRWFFFVASAIRTLWPHRVLGTSQAVHLPGVFVCNHSLCYGPIAAWLFLPFAHRPWVLGALLRAETAAVQLEKGCFARIPLPGGLRRWLLGLWAPLLSRGLRAANPIAVYRAADKRVLTLLEESVDALCAGENLLIFPEDPKKVPLGRYPSRGIGELYGGFLHLARLYRARTGRELTFYPTYACRARRTLRIGRGMRMDPALPFRQEKERMRRELRENILHLARREEPDGVPPSEPDAPEP
ncbi:MAG: hypothetical protein PHD32_09605 [Eubacteriales bacterium]|nr:hypothetical protein [Eubacteriales bacterium]